MMTSYCQVCGRPKEPSEYPLKWCGGCETATNEATQNAKAERPEINDSELLYVGRMARQSRAHTTFSGRVDPRLGSIRG